MQNTKGRKRFIGVIDICKQRTLHATVIYWASAALTYGLAWGLGPEDPVTLILPHFREEMVY